MLSVFFGKQEIVPYQMHNSSDVLQTFSIVIEDVDADILPVNEFEIITDATEWKYWNTALGITEPSSYDIIQGNTLVLEPDERVTVLFKCLTYRAIDPHLKNK